MEESEWTSIHLIAREEAGKIIQEHLGWCPFTKLQIEPRLRLQEQRFYALVGFMLGSGVLGGAAGAALFKALGG